MSSNETFYKVFRDLVLRNKRVNAGVHEGQKEAFYGNNGPDNGALVLGNEAPNAVSRRPEGSNS